MSEEGEYTEEMPRKWRELNPLITQKGWRHLERIRSHPDAPRWNETVGDRVRAEDLKALKAFRERIHKKSANSGWKHGARRHENPFAPPPGVIEWVKNMRPRSPIFQEFIPLGSDLARDWAYLPTMSRRDLATRLADMTPVDADLERIIAYDTTGTTGHAVDVPHHPQTLALNHAIGEFALAEYGVDATFSAGEVACFNICAQVNTYVFPAVFSVWNQAGFAKINLHPKDWLEPGEDWASGEGLKAAMERARRYFRAFLPRFISADPVAIAEMIRWGVGHGARAIFSTAVELSPGLKSRAEAYFNCPVIDWYSSTETGPIAFSAPDGRGMQIAAPDIWVEALDEDGFPVAPGEIGELVVTGGRNPYLPLLRYRTGDFGRVIDGRIHDLHGRKMVFFRAPGGSLVNPVDIGRIMRLHCAFALHQFVQYPDGRCEVRVRPVPGVPVDISGLKEKVLSLFSKDARVEVLVDERLGEGQPGGKVEPYVQLGEV